MSTIVVDTAAKHNQHGGVRAGAKMAEPKLIKHTPLKLTPDTQHIIDSQLLENSPLRSAQHLPTDCWEIADNLSQLSRTIHQRLSGF